MFSLVWSYTPSLTPVTHLVVDPPQNPTTPWVRVAGCGVRLDSGLQLSYRLMGLPPLLVALSFRSGACRVLGLAWSWG